jgi:hypothetical protein
LPSADTAIARRMPSRSFICSAKQLETVQRIQRKSFTTSKWKTGETTVVQLPQQQQRHTFSIAATYPCTSAATYAAYNNKHVACRVCLLWLAAAVWCLTFLPTGATICCGAWPKSMCATTRCGAWAIYISSRSHSSRRHQRQD